MGGGSSSLCGCWWCMGSSFQFITATLTVLDKIPWSYVKKYKSGVSWWVGKWRNVLFEEAQTMWEISSVVWVTCKGGWTSAGSYQPGIRRGVMAIRAASPGLSCPPGLSDFTHLCESLFIGEHGTLFLGPISAFGPQITTAWCHLDLPGCKKIKKLCKSSPS